MSFPRYPKYERSGMEWLGEVSQYWEMERLGRTGRLSKGDGGTESRKMTVFFPPLSRILPNDSFGYRTITVERPQRSEAGNLVFCTRGKQKGQPHPDSSLGDTENVPLTEDGQAYFEREVLPHAPDAWIDPDKTKVGYEIPFNRHFYVFEPPRALEEIDADLAACTDRIKAMIEGLTA